MIFLEGQESTPEMISAFGGYNHNISINANEFYDMKNASCDAYPLAANRGKRGFLSNNKDIIGICGKDKLTVLYDTLDSYDRATSSTQAARTKESIEANGGTYNADGTVDIHVPFTAYSGADTGRLIETIPQHLSTWSIKEYTSFGSTTSIENIKTIKAVDYNDISALSLIFDTSTPDGNGDYPTFSARTFSNYLVIGPMTCAARSLDETLTGSQFLIENDTVLSDLKTDWSSLESVALKIKFLDSQNRAREITTSKIEEVTISNTTYYKVTATNALDATYADDNCPAFLFFGKFTLAKDHTVNDTNSISIPAFNPVTTFTMTWTEDDPIADMENPIVTMSGETVKVTKITIPDNTLTGSITVYGAYPAITSGDNITFASPHRIEIAQYDLENQQYSEGTVICESKSGKRQTIEMGAYVVILPEKYVVNTTKIENGAFTDIKPMEATVNGSMSVTVCDGNDDTINVNSVGTTPPSSPANGTVWVDTTNGDAPVMKRYSKELGYWAEVTPYLKLKNSAFENCGLDEGDAVRINWNGSTLVSPAKGQKYYVIHSKKGTGSGAYITVPCAIKGSAWVTNSTQTINPVDVTRNMPVMDYVVESGNRLWGCRFGENIDGETVNEIYASKLGDPCNWNYFANTSIDSYYVSLGSDGPFTGAVNYQTTPVFFKTDVVHRITGYYPANYQVRNVEGYGVKPGCDESVVVMNNIVYYLSTVGMMVYSGEVPVPICQPFGTELYHDGIAGTVGNKYYISMKDEEEIPHLFVYDDSKAMWHHEDNTDAKLFATFDNECYMVTADNRLIATGGITGTTEGAVEWMLQSGDIGYTNPYNKRLLKLLLRLQMELTAYADIYIQYDSDGTWRHCHSIRPTGRTGSVNLPIMPQRCDHFAIKLEGKGEFKMLSATRFYTVGSDVT